MSGRPTHRSRSRGVARWSPPARPVAGRRVVGILAVGNTVAVVILALGNARTAVVADAIPIFINVTALWANCLITVLIAISLLNAALVGNAATGQGNVAGNREHQCNEPIRIDSLIAGPFSGYTGVVGSTGWPGQRRRLAEHTVPQIANAAPLP